MILGWNCKFTPQSIDILLLIIHLGVLHHVISCRRMGTICSDEKIEGDFNFGISGSGSFIGRLYAGHFKPSFVALEISAGEFMIEVDFHVWHGSEFVQKHLVQCPTIDREIGLSGYQYCYSGLA